MYVSLCIYVLSAHLTLEGSERRRVCRAVSLMAAGAVDRSGWLWRDLHLKILYTYASQNLYFFVGSEYGTLCRISRGPTKYSGFGLVKVETM